MSADPKILVAIEKIRERGDIDDWHRLAWLNSAHDRLIESVRNDDRLMLAAGIERPWIVNKSGWPLGEWTNEVDADVFTADGFRCTIGRDADAGHFFGYVHVMPGHPAYGLSTGDLWGLLMPLEETTGFKIPNLSIAHAATPGSAPIFAPDSWTVGFDCGHLGQTSPARAERGDYNSRYEDIDDVRRMVRALAALLKSAGGAA